MLKLAPVKDLLLGAIVNILNFNETIT